MQSSIVLCGRLVQSSNLLAAYSPYVGNLRSMLQNKKMAAVMAPESTEGLQGLGPDEFDVNAQATSVETGKDDLNITEEYAKVFEAV